jgi:hypothetical protein
VGLVECLGLPRLNTRRRTRLAIAGWQERTPLMREIRRDGLDP